MASSFIKYDDSGINFSANCFPVRNLNKSIESGGAWLVAQRAEQRRRFKAVLCAKPKDYARVHADRIKGTKQSSDGNEQEEEEEEGETNILDGFFLMRKCCVDDPADLCTVNISGQGLIDCREEDFSLFENVAFINAAENLLVPENFRNFHALRELDLSLNGLRSIKLSSSDLPNLQVLNVSYNNLSADDVRVLSCLPLLRTLFLSGNGLSTLPQDLSQTSIDGSGDDNVRFSKLERLMLDENRLATSEVFAALATLPKLRYLNLAKNSLKRVPLLAPAKNSSYIVADELVDFDDATETKSARDKKTRPKSSRSRLARSARSEKLGLSVKSTSIDTAATQPSSNAALPASVPSGSILPAPVPSVATATLADGNGASLTSSVLSDHANTSPTVDPSAGLSVTGSRATPPAISVHVPHQPNSNIAQSEDIGTSNNIVSLASAKDSETAREGGNEVDLFAGNVGNEKTVASPTADGSVKRTESRAEQLLRELSQQQSAIESTHVGDDASVTLRTDDSTLSAYASNNPADGTAADKTAANLEIPADNSMFTGEYSIEDMQFEEIDLTAIEDKIKEEKAQEEGYVETPTESARLPPDPPFAHLEKLDLSYNQIAEEKSLLPVASWPSLMDLIIHNNPLTTEHSGDPILLTPFLHERLGIAIHRKKEAPVKPNIDMPRKEDRKVKVLVPPMPRRTADELLAILMPPPVYSPHPPLPPLDSPHSRHMSPSGDVPQSTDIPPVPAPTSEPTDVDGFIDSTAQDDATGAPFFMTQVDDQGEQRPKPPSSKRSTGGSRQQQPPADDGNDGKHKKRHRKHKVEKKYEGYEELLVEDEDMPIDDVPQPTDIQGNVRALHYMLEHPVIYRDSNNVQLDRRSRHYQPPGPSRLLPPPQAPRKTYQENIDEVLYKMKNRKFIMEAPLSEVIRHREKYKHAFGDAEQLLGQVQRRYNQVRESSMRDAKQLAATVDSVASLARNYSLTEQKKRNVSQN